MWRENISKVEVRVKARIRFHFGNFILPNKLHTSIQTNFQQSCKPSLVLNSAQLWALITFQLDVDTLGVCYSAEYLTFEQHRGTTLATQKAPVESNEPESGSNTLSDLLHSGTSSKLFRSLNLRSLGWSSLCQLSRDDAKQSKHIITTSPLWWVSLILGEYFMTVAW